MRSLIKPARDAVAEPHGNQAEGQGQREVGGGGERPPGAQQVESLEAEGGEGGVAAAQPDHDELPPKRADQQASVRAGEGGEEADDEGADDIDEDRHPRKSHRPQRRRQQAAAIARRAAERAAEADREICGDRVHRMAGERAAPDSVAGKVIAFTRRMLSLVAIRLPDATGAAKRASQPVSCGGREDASSRRSEREGPRERRMRVSIRGLAVLSLVIVAVRAGAQPPPVLGRWLSESGKGVIEIYPCADKLCGKLVWLADPIRDGAPAVDRDNKDAALRQRPLCGLMMLGDFRQLEAKRWGDGWIYSPENGKTYRATMTLDGELLKLRGYIGIPLFGETQTWTRADAKQNGC